ncbi:MAG: SDR family oxidoreductase [Clostridiales bacterium]|nr:SDR family oxidoreductase [Clostridiales bacterium]
MKALFIGGTGTISTAVSRLCVERGWELTLLNRGNADARVPEGAKVLHADIRDEQAVSKALEGHSYDVVADFIAYTPEQAERDTRLFHGRTAQYIFISSASAYQKPLSSPWITEGTPLANPYWEYSRLKAACEETLMRAYREEGFPVTIIRPSHTYCERSIPVALHGKNGSFAVVERIRKGQKVIVPGDGLTLWTFTHSSDFAVGFVGLMGNVHALGEAFHITGDERLTWNQAYEAVGAALGVKPKLVHIASETLGLLCEGYKGRLLGDKSNTVLFDNAKLKRAVPEFCTVKRYDQGVREAAEYIYAHPECQKPDPEFDAWCDAAIEGYEAMVAKLPRLEI